MATNYFGNLSLPWINHRPGPAYGRNRSVDMALIADRPVG
jgi:hypothetical protein